MTDDPWKSSKSSNSYDNLKSPLFQESSYLITWCLPNVPFRFSVIASAIPNPKVRYLTLPMECIRVGLYTFTKSALYKSLFNQPSASLS